MTLQDRLKQLGASAVNTIKSGVSRVMPQVQNFVSNQANKPVIGPNLVSNPLTPRNIVNTTSGYLQNQVGKPIVEGTKTVIKNPSWLQKGLGALNIAGGLWSATPHGIAYNSGTGAASGLIKSVRTGENPYKTVQHGITHPTMISEGLGIKNAWLGLAIDVLATVRDPSKLPQDFRSFKNLLTKKNSTEAATSLKQLMSYENELINKGIPQRQAQKMSLQQAKKLLGWDAETAQKALEEAKLFSKQKEQSFNNIFATFIGKRQASESIALQRIQPFKNIPNELGMQIIHKIENPGMKVPEEAAAWAKRLGIEYKNLYNEAIKAGIDMPYRPNYVNHLWAEPDNIVEQAFKRAGQTPGFAKKRTFNTYAEGIMLGKLTPRYNTPQQLLGEYIRQLEVNKANVQLLSELKKEGLIEKSMRPGFAPINSEGFPAMFAKNADNEVVRSVYFAPQEIAQTLNKVFSPQEDTKLLGKAAQASSTLQNYNLAGGFSTFNSFALNSGLQRSILAGRFKDITHFIRSFHPYESDKFFTNHLQDIIELQKNNVSINTELSIKNIIDENTMARLFGGKQTSWGKQIGSLYGQLMEAGTFERFLPSLKISLYSDLKSQAMRKGMDEMEAVQVAAKGVKNFFGEIGTENIAKQSKFSEDMKRLLFFAPQYRQSLIHFYINSIKALGDPLKIENQTNIRFMLGSLIQYLFYNHINKVLNGHYMWDNEGSHKGELLVPLSKVTGDDNNETVVGLPFLSSLMTVPKASLQMMSDILSGSSSNLANDMKAFLSQGVRAPLDVMSNQNYYGQAIRDTKAPPEEQLAQIFKHVGKEYTSPQIRFIIESMDKNDHQDEIIKLAKLFEIPIKITDRAKLDAAAYYESRDMILKDLSEKDKKVYDVLHAKDDKDLQDSMSAASLRLANPEVVKAETRIALQSARSGKKEVDPFYKIPFANQRIMLLYSSLPPGSQERSQLLKAYQWIPEVWNARDKFFVTQPYHQKVDTLQKSAELNNKLADYYELPSGTGQRTRYLSANPEVLQYFQQQREQTNDKREQLGLVRLADYSSKPAGTTGSKGIKGMKKLKAKKPTLKKVKIKKLKIKKLKKIKKIKPVKMKPTKLNIKPLEAQKMPSSVIG